MKFKKIIIFSEHSKKKGLGHYIRSKRLYDCIKKKFNTKLLFNKKKKEIRKILSNLNHNSLIIFDLSKYSKKVFIKNKKIFYIIFENSKIKIKNSIIINPLDLDKKNLSGPKWFAYPNNFFDTSILNKKKKNFNNIFISQGGTDAYNNLKNIIKLLNPLQKKLNLKLFVKVPKKNYFHQKFIKKHNVREVHNLNNIKSFLSNIDLSICGCGNLSFEINFWGIPAVFVSSIKKEIIRGKKLQNIGFGKFYIPSQREEIREEICKIVYNELYYNKIKRKKKLFFKHNGLKNLTKLISKLFNA